jgi:hypothetical protein
MTAIAHANGKHCRTIPFDCHDGQSNPDCPCYDDRTPEQHADVAAGTLHRLAEIRKDLDEQRWQHHHTRRLRAQLQMLADWAGDHDLPQNHAVLAAVTEASMPIMTACRNAFAT